MNERDPQLPPDAIAIVGMSGRFPGAPDVETFWANLRAGVESVSFFTVEELIEAGVPAALVNRPDYVRAKAVLADADTFDAEFFGYLPAEVEMMDPQHRVFLECAWAALEDAGYDPLAAPGVVGVFGGMSQPTYPSLIQRLDPAGLKYHGYPLRLGTDKDYLTLRVSYKLNLRGPSMAVQTACSTSLVAVCEACKSLLGYHCDTALAGGVSVTVPLKAGQRHTEGGIHSADGHCRAFDQAGQGIVEGEGVGLVVLKRLADAIADGHTIHAVIRGFAVNNDGAGKVGFTAPSPEGQADAIAAALALADVPAESISYIEAHGTGTRLGDPIEIAGLTKAFASDRTGFCSIGSVKTNIGHLDTAAGVAGLIKTVLALKHRELPPSLHYTEANPSIGIEQTPFVVNSTLRPWDDAQGRRRAGVSSFGLGGTNAHVILEEAPSAEPTAARQPMQLVPLSARTETALSAAALGLARSLVERAGTPIADVAFTLQTGRHPFAERRVVVAADTRELILALSGEPAPKTTIGRARTSAPSIVFLFPGQGVQHVNMGRELYDTEPVFRAEVDRCAHLLQPHLGRDLRAVLYPDAATAERAHIELTETWLTQPSLFVVEYALARLWMSWGIQPAAMIGHSVGEYVAACLSGVLAVEDALMLLARRARMMQDLPGGSMLAVRLSETDVRMLLGDDCSVAAINSPALSVVSGPTLAIGELEQRLKVQGVACRRLSTSHAFHSSMMDPIESEFTALVRTVERRAPQIPYISNVTSTWITHDDVADPAYWFKHLRGAVHFSDGVARLAEDSDRVFVEVGPGRSLGQLVRQHPDRKREQPVLASLTPDGNGDVRSVLMALGELWVVGAEVTWSALHQGGERHRVSLPTYPFERQRFWPTAADAVPTPDMLPGGRVDADRPSPATVETPASTPLAGPDLSDRRGNIQQRVNRLLHDVSGLSADEIAIDRTFLELGFDSLLLGQVAQAFEKAFAVNVRVRDFMDTAPTPADMAAWLESRLPAEDLAPTPATASATAVLSTSDAPSAPAAHGPFRPVSRSAGPTLAPESRAALDGIIDRYARRTAGSKALAQRYRRVLADPRTSAGFSHAWKEIVYPIYSTRSEGARLWDVDGHEYIDFVMGFGAELFGHRPAFLNEAISRQLDLGFETGPIQAMVGETAECVRELTGMERVAFCNTGSEAVLAALRMARAVTGRDKIAMFAGAYHGMFDEVLARRGGAQAALPIAPGIPASATSQVVILDYGTAESLAWLREHAGTLAALVVEPVQSRRLELQPRAFLHELRVIADASGAALVFDEIVTGFRVAPGGAQAHFGVTADIAAYGKVIGGGMPIGVVAGRARFLDALDGGHWSYGDASYPDVGVTFFAGTFVRHPLAIAAARAVLEHLMHEGPALQQRLAAVAADAAERISALVAKHQLPVTITHFAGLLGVSVSPSAGFGSLLHYLLRHHGIHVWENRNLVFTTAHTSADVDRLVDAFDASLAELAASGLVPLQATAPVPAEAAEAASAAGDSLDLTGAQREVWLAALQGDAAAQSYVVTLLVDLRGALDRGALGTAVQGLMDRHDSLRAAFEHHEPRQHMAGSLSLDLAFEDVASLDSTDARHAMLARARHMGETPFDMTQPPLIRAALVRLAPDHHVLILSSHHLVVDGWSTGVILRELLDLYDAARQGRPPVLPDALQFRAYAQLLLGPRHQAQRTASMTYWRGVFADVPAPLDLPTDRLRPTTKSFGASRVTVAWPEGVARQLKTFGASRGATLMHLLLAGFACVLQRLSGQGDLVIGVPAAGQNAPGVQGVPGHDALVGHCVSLLPVRCAVDPAASFDDLVRDTRRRLLDALDHQAVSFGELVEALHLPRDNARVPLVSVLLNVDRVPAVVAAGGIEMRVDELARTALVFDLSVNVVDDDRGLTLHWDFNTDLFEAAAVQRWCGHLLTLLCSAMDGSATPVGDLDVLTESERHDLLVLRNQTARPLSGRRLHERFEAHARATPRATALRHGEHVVTYATLESRANRLARLLRQAGVGAGVPVAFLLERTPEMVATMLAILKAGGAYVPLDARYPRERIAAILEDAQVPVVITERQLMMTLPGSTARLVVIETEEAAIAGMSDAPLDMRPADDTDLAYVLFTSGSTGRPKGVAIEHRAAVNFVDWATNVFDAADLGAVLFATSVGFDLSVFELFVPLSVGGTAIIVPDVLAAPAVKGPISLINTVPSAMAELVRGGNVPSSIRCVNLAGEALPDPLVEEIHAALPMARVYNLYGPTETTTYSTCTLVGREARVTVGHPIDNTQVYVLDTRGHLVPPGAAGELYIGGAGLARGYLGRADLTAERFVSWQPPTGAPVRLYRTGDRCRWRDDGQLEYTGRLDSQVKLRGFRIELGEIEAQLLRHPAVAAAAVVIREDRPDDRQLVGYVEVVGPPPSPMALQVHLRATVPEYMVPRRFVVLDRLPHTANGKIDRKNLPAPDASEAGGRRVDPPVGETEVTLAGFWQDLLGVSQVGRADDFFELGGHSLLVVRLVSRIQQRFGLSLPMSIVVDARTVAALAHQIDVLKTVSLAPVSITGGDREDIEL